jgi:FtsP/CotA-like multicopper oxidase with cupredoxin domain
MTRFNLKLFGAGIARSFTKLTALLVLLISASAQATILGETGTNFDLTASEGYISIADGGSVYSWGYSVSGASQMQLPGPTLIVNEGDTVTVKLRNHLPVAAGNVSIVFPGHDVSVLDTDAGVPGDITQEASSGSTVTYTFVAGEPGTYQYHSGTQPDLQVEMGLYGALIVKPLAAAAGCTASAYNHSDTCFDREYLFLLSEVDIDIHQAAELQVGGPGPVVLPAGAYHSEYWLMNGRAAPDTMAAAGDSLLPSQPYNIIPRMHPGEKLLIRLVSAGREMHPFHTHGNHARVLARDGRLLTSGPGASGQLAGPLLFTIPSVPGGTVDAIFQWTGKDLGWDMYGHPPDDVDVPPFDDPNVAGDFPGAGDTDHNGNNVVDITPLEPNEWAPDHGIAIPVDLPSLNSLAFGGFYSGSPFLGALGSLPPGEGGLNPDAGFTYMWHSHNERELVNNDVFPGGMMTMLIIEAPGITID